MARAHELVVNGQVGNVINVESYYGLNTRIPAFRDYPVPNVLPWIYNLRAAFIMILCLIPFMFFLNILAGQKKLR